MEKAKRGTGALSAMPTLPSDVLNENASYTPKELVLGCLMTEMDPCSFFIVRNDWEDSLGMSESGF